MTVAGILSALTAIATVVGAIWGLWRLYFSAEAKLRRRDVADAHAQGRESTEAERLRAAYDRIAREPPKDGQDLVDDLNKKFKP